MSTEQIAKRFIRAARAAQFRKNSQNELFLRNSDIVTMRISAGTLRRSSGRCKDFGFVQYAL